MSWKNSQLFYFKREFSWFKRLGSISVDKGNYLREGFFLSFFLSFIIFFFLHFCPSSFDPEIKRTLETNVSFLAGVCDDLPCSVSGLISLSACISALKQPAWRESSVFLDLPMARPEPLRMERVFFKFTDNPTDCVQHKQRAPVRSFVWPAILGTLWIFAWFCPLPILRSSCLLFPLYAARWISSEPSLLGWVSFHCPKSSSQMGLHRVLSFLQCVHEPVWLLCHLVPI